MRSKNKTSETEFKSYKRLSIAVSVLSLLFAIVTLLVAIHLISNKIENLPVASNASSTVASYERRGEL